MPVICFKFHKLASLLAVQDKKPHHFKRHALVCQCHFILSKSNLALATNTALRMPHALWTAGKPATDAVTPTHFPPLLQQHIDAHGSILCKHGIKESFT
jgi:hypothetical protein